MNLKFKELAEQAKAEIRSEEEIEGIAYNDFDEQVMEKFAELIIKECLTFIEPMPGSGDIDDIVLEGATKEIKEHFGIR